MEDDRDSQEDTGLTNTLTYGLRGKGKDKRIKWENNNANNIQIGQIQGRVCPRQTEQ